MLRIAIIGGSGYTGLELLRFLSLHPAAEVVVVSSRQYAGRSIQEVFPSLSGYEELSFSAPELESLSGRADYFFTAVPHQAAMGIVPQLLEAGGKVIDLSADFRLHDRRTYEVWYQEHQAPELLSEAVYGLPELYSHEICEARLVANPGCYPTSAILPLAPLLRDGLVGPEGLVIDSKSGVSGAGRSASLATSFCEVNEGLKAYKVACHHHIPEIEQELSTAAGIPVVVSFTPHLVPMARGILTTIYASLTRPLTTEELLNYLLQSYAAHPFVRVMPPGTFPNTAHVSGSNYCHIGAKVDERTGRAVLLCAIDNLVKGASGQAIQNLNIMAGIEETLGLEVLPLFP